MTIDEAIKSAEEEAKEQDKLCKRYDDASGYTRSHNKDIRTTDAKRCEECAEDHRQLAEWLKELKAHREKHPFGDCISRQALQEWIKDKTFGDIVVASEHNFDCLPPVEPKRKTGKWILKHRTHNSVKHYTGQDEMGETHTISVLERYEVDEPYCSECGKLAGDTSQDYCCACGAKMEEVN